MKFYHGSDHDFTELLAGSWVTPDVRVASWFGSKVYEFDADPDQQAWKRRDPDEGLEYAKTRVIYPVTRVANLL